MPCRTLASALFLFAALPAQTEQSARPGKIEGIVMGPGEKGVPMAEVWAVVNGKEVARVMADGSGYFTFPRLPLGPVNLHGTREDWTLGQASTTLTRAQAHARVRIRVVAGGAIRGRVLDPDGEPIAGAHVVVSPSASSTAPDSFDVTDDQGQFALEHVPVGTAELWVVARGFDMEKQPCDVPTMEQTFRLERADDEQGYQDFGKLLEQVTIRPYRSSKVRRNGVQILQIDPELGKRFALQNGDVVLQVNGVPVLSPAQAHHTVAGFHARGIRAFRIRLMTMGRIESRVYVAPAR